MRVLRTEGKGKTTYRTMTEDKEGLADRPLYKVQAITEVEHPKETASPNPDTGELFEHTPAMVRSLSTASKIEPLSEMDDAISNSTMGAVEKDFPSLSVSPAYKRGYMHPAHSQFVVGDESGNIPEEVGTLIPSEPRPIIKSHMGKQFSQNMLPGMAKYVAVDGMPPMTTTKMVEDAETGERNSISAAVNEVIKKITDPDNPDFV